MKKLFTLFAVALCAGLVVAGDYFPVKITVPAAGTTTTADIDLSQVFGEKAMFVFYFPKYGSDHILYSPMGTRDARESRKELLSRDGEMVGYEAIFLIDPKVMEKETVYTGGGSENSLVLISPPELQRANQGRIVRIRK